VPISLSNRPKKKEYVFFLKRNKGAPQGETGGVTASSLGRMEEGDVVLEIAGDELHGKWGEGLF